jgi:hypothetical protein
VLIIAVAFDTQANVKGLLTFTWDKPLVEAVDYTAVLNITALTLAAHLVLSYSTYAGVL